MRTAISGSTLGLVLCASGQDAPEATGLCAAAPATAEHPPLPKRVEDRLECATKGGHPRIPLDLEDWAEAYHGDNYARLVRVKRAYDPGGLLRFPQCVSP